MGISKISICHIYVYIILCVYPIGYIYLSICLSNLFNGKVLLIISNLSNLLIY